MTVGFGDASWTVLVRHEVPSWQGLKSMHIVDKGILARPRVNVGWDLLLSSVPRGTMFGVALDTH